MTQERKKSDQIEAKAKAKAKAKTKNTKQNSSFFFFFSYPQSTKSQNARFITPKTQEGNHSPPLFVFILFSDQTQNGNKPAGEFGGVDQIESESLEEKEEQTLHQNGQKLKC